MCPRNHLAWSLNMPLYKVYNIKCSVSWCMHLKEGMYTERKIRVPLLQGQISVAFITEVSTWFRSGVSRGELRVASSLWGRRLCLLLSTWAQPLLPVSSDCGWFPMTEALIHQQPGYPELRTFYYFRLSPVWILCQVLASQISEMMEDRESHLSFGENSYILLYYITYSLIVTDSKSSAPMQKAPGWQADRVLGFQYLK